LRAFTCSTTELRTCVRKESNLRPCDRSNSTLHHRHVDTIREQAIAETPARRSPCGPGSALSAELPAHGTPGGIRTRDLSFWRRSNSDLHHGSCKGAGEQARTARPCRRRRPLLSYGLACPEGGEPPTVRQLSGQATRQQHSSPPAWGTRSGNGRLLKPRPAGREVVYSEVTAIFTTDREQVGGEQATLLPLRRALTELRHFCRRDLNHATSEPQKADGALTRSNSDLHHRLAEAHCCTRQS